MKKEKENYIYNISMLCPACEEKWGETVIELHESEAMPFPTKDKIKVLDRYKKSLNNIFKKAADGKELICCPKCGHGYKIMEIWIMIMRQVDPEIEELYKKTSKVITNQINKMYEDYENRVL